MTSGYFYTITEKTNIKVFGKGSGEEPFLCIVFLTQLICIVSEEVILGDFYYANLVMPSSSISPSSLNALSG